MATILSLNRRIDAARNVSKTTRAMQMISASKLKKAQNSAVSTRPYVSELAKLTQNVVTKIDKQSFEHPYIKNKLGQLSNNETGRLIKSSWESVLDDKNHIVFYIVSQLLREGISIETVKKFLNSLMIIILF